MARIASLCDALIKTKIEEDQATNFLLWLVRTLPVEVVELICAKAGLTIAQPGDVLDTISQVNLLYWNSKPDGRIEFSGGLNLIIETKRGSDAYDHSQFQRHLKGATEKFGRNNVRLLFLSGDEHAHEDLAKMMRKHPGRIGFISWKSLLQCLEDYARASDEKAKTLIREFIVFAKHYKLGRLTSMNEQQLRAFFEAYPVVIRYQEAAKEYFLGLIDRIVAQVEHSEIRVSRNEDQQEDELPVLYKAFDVAGWHIQPSSYVFIDVVLKKIGIVLVGYEHRDKKTIFLNLWNDIFKHQYKGKVNLSALTWVDEDGEEYSHFKPVGGYNGLGFNPSGFSEFNDHFYWGQLYDLGTGFDPDKPEKLAKDFTGLLDIFRNKTGGRHLVKANKIPRLKR